VPEEQVERLPIWEGDRIFFRLLREERPFFLLKLVYDGGTLTQAVLDGVPLRA
jgi:8-oxo-dGTP diphosphatase